jgi:hypothetical protein
VNQVPGKEPFFHRGLAVLEVAEARLLDELLTDPDVRARVWHRLSPTRAAVDPQEVEILTRRLEARGLALHFARELSP